MKYKIPQSGISLLLIFSFYTVQGQIKNNDFTAIENKVIEWRHHLHQNPELSNREFKTSAYVAEHLKNLGISVQTGVAHTGVVGLLKGKRPGRVVALRADMDGLPVRERVDLPYKSEATALFNGQETGVMHACGHDVHASCLMGVAKVLHETKAVEVEAAAEIGEENGEAQEENPEEEDKAVLKLLDKELNEAAKMAAEMLGDQGADDDADADLHSAGPSTTVSWLQYSFIKNKLFGIHK